MVLFIVYHSTLNLPFLIGDMVVLSSKINAESYNASKLHNIIVPE